MLLMTKTKTNRIVAVPVKEKLVVAPIITSAIDMTANEPVPLEEEDQPRDEWTSHFVVRDVKEIPNGEQA
jgi:hypothetical protein